MIQKTQWSGLTKSLEAPVLMDWTELSFYFYLTCCWAHWGHPWSSLRPQPSWSPWCSLRSTGQRGCCTGWSQLWGRIQWRAVRSCCGSSRCVSLPARMSVLLKLFGDVHVVCHQATCTVWNMQHTVHTLCAVLVINFVHVQTCCWYLVGYEYCSTQLLAFGYFTAIQ